MLFGFLPGLFHLAPLFGVAAGFFLPLVAKFRLPPLFGLSRRLRQFGLPFDFGALPVALFLRQTIQFFTDRDFVHHLGRNRFDLGLLGMQRIRDIQIQQ